ncbi:MAG: type II CAAX endopeptidase family protein [Woeseiaceae bacterium]
MKTYLFDPAPEGHRTTWIWAVPVLVFVLFIAGQLLVLLPAKFLGQITKEAIETYPTVLYLVIGTFSMVAVLFFLWIRLFERRSLASAGTAIGTSTTRNYVRGYLYGLLMAAAVVYAVRWLGGYSVESPANIVVADLGPVVILMFAFMLQSFTEEFVFRGWMMGRIAERFGLVAGVVGNSILFTLMHVDVENLQSIGASGVAIFVSGTLLFSIFLSLLVIHEKSVWGAAAWHASWNWMFITWFGLPTTGIELGLAPLVADYMPTPDAAVWLTGGADGPEGSVFMPVVLALGCFAVAWFSLRRSSTTPRNFAVE